MMIGADACWRHRDELAALAGEGVATAVPTPTGRAALDHVDHCPACASALGELMLTAVALRRMGSGAAEAEAAPNDDAWTRLRLRIEQSSRRAREQAWRWRATLGGLATASLLVALVVGPASIQLTATIGIDEPTGQAGVLLDLPDWQTELGYVSAARRTIDAAPLDDATSASGGATARTIYPDGIRPERKEVPSGRATTRFPEAG
jgi:hypothetical protein